MSDFFDQTVLERGNPPIREFLIFMLGGPPIGFALLGITSPNLSDLFTGILMLMSPYVIFSYIPGFFPALITGLAWQFVNTPWNGAMLPHWFRRSALICIGGMSDWAAFSISSHATIIWRVVLHGVIVAGVCGLIAELTRTKSCQ